MNLRLLSLLTLCFLGVSLESIPLAPETKEADKPYFPKKEEGRRVYDLSSQRGLDADISASIEKDLKFLENEHRVQVVILVMDQAAMGGILPEEYCQRISHKWRIGEDAPYKKGAVFLLLPDKGWTFCTTGNLLWIFRDQSMGQLIQKVNWRLRSGDVNGGVTEWVRGMISILNSEKAPRDTIRTYLVPGAAYAPGFLLSSKAVISFLHAST